MYEALIKHSADPSPHVKTHVQRILNERGTWTKEVRAVALAGLSDSSADVQRAATQALGAHPEIANIEPLLKLRGAVPSDDPHLTHVVRMALRDHFGHDDTAKAIGARAWIEPQLSDLADVCPGAHTPESARFLTK